ncbi:MAG TPA: hypothetical protein VHE30_25310 [Polyangiaceae bacterium]|nr:hypothetical protein [Polyangiaceae bacterium]
MKRAVLSALALAATLLPRAAHAEEDRWFGSDKALHFGVSAGLGAGGYAASALFLEPRYARVLAGSAFSLTLGAGKELYDLSGHGDPSWKDFTWDVVGTAVGVGVALLVDLAVSPKDAPTPGTATMAIRF